MSDVIDLVEHHLDAHTLQTVEGTIRQLLSTAVTNVASMYDGGQPPAWIERKTTVSVNLVMEMLTLLDRPVSIPLPDTLTDGDRVEIERAVAAWALHQNEQCRAAFFSRIVALLEP